MISDIKKFKPIKAISIILLLLCILLVTGCTSAPSRGWSGPLVKEGVLYVGTIEGKVIALDLTSISDGTPDLKWDKDVGAATGGGGFSCSTRVSKPMGVYGTPVLYEGRLYVGAYNGDILYFNISDGSRSDPFSTDGAIVGDPVVDGDSVFVASSDGKLYAFDLDLHLKPGWPFKTGDKIWSTPVVRNGIVYISSADHKLYAVDTASGKEIWHFEAEAAILSTPLVVDGTMIYIGACDRKFYALDAATEEERLNAVSRQEGSPVPVREAKSVFDGAGNWFWTQALPYNGEIWVGCLDHSVYALDAVTLEERARVTTQGMVYAPPVLLGDRIIVGSQDGRVYAIDPETRDWTAYTIEGDTDSSTPDVYVSQDTELLKEAKKPLAPIFAPLYAGSDNDTVYFHAQDGTHTLYALALSTEEVVWSFRTDKISE
ncbi:MAG: PQQ-binding-like beta-propeller repeat protein [Chloroflexi bacterium]|nr:PQQ-binding-like beta-propeller repeat protein [Chloroflexota bacterium]